MVFAACVCVCVCGGGSVSGPSARALLLPAATALLPCLPRRAALGAGASARARGRQAAAIPTMASGGAVGGGRTGGRAARVVGLIGGIASGKSTVSRLLAKHGAAVIDADKVAHRVRVGQASGPGDSGSTV